MDVMTGTDTHIHRMEIGEAIWSILSALSVLESQYCHFVIRNRAAKNLLIDEWFMEYYIMKRPL